MERIFVSSVQKEFAAERQALRDFVRRDPLLRQFFDVFLFEDGPASGRSVRSVYLGEVDRCTVYVALLGHDYGSEDREGISPTEREFDRATAQRKERLVFLRHADDSARVPKLQAFVRKIGTDVVRRRFSSTDELLREFSASLVAHLTRRGLIQSLPIEQRPCAGASLADIDPEAIRRFVALARHERQFPLAAETSPAEVLAHLNLLSDGQPTGAAVLLFGREPHRFLPAAEVRCMHFHGVEVARPVPLYRVIKGNLFEQVDRATDFVLSVVNRSVGTRDQSTRAPVAYEIPPPVVREAVVNAVAHRDYASSGAVQVAVFSDRVEVWNPGELLPPLTPAGLRAPHSSLSRNPRICEALFLARYIEKFGTGTLMMIRESRAHSLPEPAFDQRPGEFIASLGRDWLTPQVLARFRLNERQRQSLDYVRAHGSITSAAHQHLTSATRKTATRDLADLVGQGVLARSGDRRAARYRLVPYGTFMGHLRHAWAPASMGHLSDISDIAPARRAQKPVRRSDSKTTQSTSTPAKRRPARKPSARRPQKKSSR